MSKSYLERREWSSGGWSYLLDDDDRTAWIKEGSTGGSRHYTLPTTVYVGDVLYQITSVEIGAFDNEPSLQSLIVPDCYEYIDMDCFSHCKKLRSVYLGKGLQEYCFWSFAGCPVQSITIDPENPYLKMSDDGMMVLSKDGKRLYSVVLDKALVTVPDGVEELHFDAISCLPHLRKLRLPSSLRRLQTEAIFENYKLKEVVLPEGVRLVGYEAVSSNENLEVLDLPSTLHRLEGRSFAYNPRLRKLILRSPFVVDMADDDAKAYPTETCTLCVPYQLLEKYKKHSFWGQFKKIVELL